MSSTAPDTQYLCVSVKRYSGIHRIIVVLVQENLTDLYTGIPYHEFSGESGPRFKFVVDECIRVRQDVLARVVEIRTEVLARVVEIKTEVLARVVEIKTAEHSWRNGKYDVDHKSMSRCQSASFSG
jgi:hypothetical protein